MLSRRTVPAAANAETTWCPVCLEDCHDHPIMCTICGETLIPAPPPDEQQDDGHEPATIGVSNQSNSMNGIPLENLPQLEQQLLASVQRMRREAAATAATAATTGTTGTPSPTPTTAHAEITSETNVQNELWQTAPPEAMNPQPETSGPATATSTSKSYLDKLNRITIHEHSSILYQATVTIYVATTQSNENGKDGGGCEKKEHESIYTFHAAVSEFYPFPPFTIQGSLHASQPIHGTHPITIPTLSSFNSTSLSSLSSVVLFMERGGDITFLQKCQNASSFQINYNNNNENINIAGIICANHNTTWPYTMKDSTSKARGQGQGQQKYNQIPIIMIQKSDGEILQSLLEKDKNQNNVQVQIQATKKPQNSNTCIICTDYYQTNDVILQLPLCKHLFHEGCIVHWLKDHNTCPYCRIELPLENDKEEDERRRRLTSNHNSGSGIGNNNNNSSGNENDDDARQQWETIFG